MQLEWSKDDVKCKLMNVRTQRVDVLLGRLQQTHTVTWTPDINSVSVITGSAAALHCCKAHSEINRKLENSTPCKIVTPENFILKLGTRDYVDKVTYYTIFGVDRFSGGFSPNR